MIPGEYFLAANPVVANAGRRTDGTRGCQRRRPPDPGRFAFSFLRGQSRACASIARGPSECGSIFPREPPCASSPATTRKSTLVGVGRRGEGIRPERTHQRPGERQSGRAKRREGKRRAKPPSRKDLRGANPHELWKFRAGNTPASTDPPRATAFAWRTPNSSSKSNATSPRRATKRNSAAARCCATAWASPPRRPRTTARSIS